MQTSYNLNQPKGINGQKADMQLDLVESLTAAVAIPVARGVVKSYGSDNMCRLPTDNSSVILDDAGTFTAGSISATINGTVITQAWGTDKNTTMTALAAAIQAGGVGVYSAVYNSGAHTITLLSRNTGLTVTVDVSGITGTMTITSITGTTTDVIGSLAGVALHTHTLIPNAVAGEVQYDATETVNVLRQGAVYVIPEETVTSDDAVYWRIRANGVSKPVGGFGKSADSGKCVAVPNARWAEGGTTTVVAKLEINLP